jgi:hypothetical protein
MTTNGRPKGPSPTRRRPTSFRYKLRHGGKCAVLIRGVARRPEHTTLVRIPRSLHDRMQKHVDGPVSTAIVALADFALMVLERDKCSLTVEGWSDTQEDSEAFSETKQAQE